MVYSRNVGKLKAFLIPADMAELADAPDLGSGVYDVQVQVLSSAFYLNHKDCKGTYHSLCTPLAEKQRTSSFFK